MELIAQQLCEYANSATLDFSIRTPTSDISGVTSSFDASDYQSHRHIPAESPRRCCACGRTSSRADLLEAASVGAVIVHLSVRSVLFIVI